MFTIESGNTAAATGVKLARVQVIAAYPITPQTPLTEKLSEFVESGEMKAEYIPVESEHSALAVCIAASSDIGIQALSGACERGENLIYICYDNEAYMNTGIQRSGATPAGAVTTTTPIHGKRQQRKDVASIVAAHDIAYVASCSSAYPLDFYTKLVKAKSMTGTRYFHVHTACPPGWGFDPRYTVKVGKLAVETGLFELYEYENGKTTFTGATAKLAGKQRKPVELYFKAQSRFKTMTDRQIKAVQLEIDQRWAERENKG